jgi:DNA-binding transcriptional MerR regulator
LIEEAKLLQIERDWPQGLSSSQILELCRTHGVSLSEATLRKYVQLGLLPRSVRVGEKGKHRGSKGLYPTRVMRRLLFIKQMMAENVTIEQIQKEFLLLGADIEEIGDALSRLLSRIHSVIRTADSGERVWSAQTLVERDIADAERMSSTLIARLERIDSQLRQAGRSAQGQSEGIRAVS